MKILMTMDYLDEEHNRQLKTDDEIVVPDEQGFWLTENGYAVELTNNEQEE